MNITNVNRSTHQKCTKHREIHEMQKLTAVYLDELVCFVWFSIIPTFYVRWNLKYTITFSNPYEHQYTNLNKYDLNIPISIWNKYGNWADRTFYMNTFPDTHCKGISNCWTSYIFVFVMLIGWIWKNYDPWKVEKQKKLWTIWNIMAYIYFPYLFSIIMSNRIWRVYTNFQCTLKVVAIY